MKIYSFTITYRPDQDEFNDAYPAGIMAVDSITGEMLFTALPADHPAAPFDHDDLVVDELMEFFEDMKQWLIEMDRKQGAALLDGPLNFTDRIDMEQNPDIEADDLDTGVLQLLRDHVLAGLGHTEVVYHAFSIVRRMGPEENYPLAVFVLDPVNWHFAGRVFGEHNPYLPRLPRQQRRAIDREMAKFIRKLERGSIQAAFEGLDRPRFGVFSIDDYQAVTSQHAIDQALADLDEIYLDTDGDVDLAG